MTSPYFKVIFLSSLMFLTILSFIIISPHSSYSQDSPMPTPAKISSILTLSDISSPVILHPATQEFPDVDEGRVVWQDHRFGPTDIFLADLSTGVITNLTQSSSWEVFPDLDGDLVVWKDGYNGVGIHGLNLSTGQIFTVTEGHSDISPPRLSENIVVWADDRAGGGDWNIYGYNLDTQTEFIISDELGRQQDPKIDGHYVVWWDYQEWVYLYDLNTQETTTILDTWGARFPDVSAADNLVIWQDIRQGPWNIYGYDLTTHTERPLILSAEDKENVRIDNGLITYQNKATSGAWNVHLHILEDNLSFPITHDSNPQVFPVVDNTTLVWQDNRHHQTDIYYYAWDGIVPPQITYPLSAPTSLQVGAYPAGKLHLQWLDPITNELGFQIERTTGITSSKWQELVTLPANTTVYTDHSGVLGESYWYRVRAYNEDGVSAYTNDSFNSTFDWVPNLDEQYLMVLINEARFDPAVFGYPAYNPAPPLAYNPNIAYSARSHSQSILNSGFQFGHCDPIGRCPGERAVAAGYPHSSCAENLVASRSGPEAMRSVNQGFLDSEGHRASMLEPGLNEFGVGHTYGPSKGNLWTSGQITEVFCGRDGVIAPAIPVGSVVPYTGTIETAFTYVVNSYNAQGQPPTTAQVIINDIAYPLTLSTGTAAQGTYRYTTTLDIGNDHRYHFWFEYREGLSARWPEVGEHHWPDVREQMPDLRPSIFVSQLNDTFYLSGSIYNAGEVAAHSVPTQVHLGHPQQGGQLLHQTTIAQINVQESAFIGFDWQPPAAGVYTFYLQIDPEQIIPDVNRGDNLTFHWLDVQWQNLYLPFITK